MSLSGVGLSFPLSQAAFTVGAKVLVTMQPVHAIVCWEGSGRSGRRFTETISRVANSGIGEVFAAQGPRMLKLLRSQV